MVDLGTYIFKDLNTGKITPEEFLLVLTLKNYMRKNMYILIQKRLRVISDAKYGKADLHKVMENQCQHLTMTQINELLNVLREFKEFFHGTLVTWETDSVEFELKEDAKPIYSRPYPLPKVHEEIFKK